MVTRTPAAEVWGRFMLAREGSRAIRWLLERDLVEEDSARRRLQELAGSASAGADTE